MKSKLFLIILLVALITGACSFATGRAVPTLTTSAPAQRASAAPGTALSEVTPTRAITQSASSTTVPAGETTEAAAQPVEIKGTFSFTNDILMTYYVEHMVAMVDLYAFTQRDQEWELPVEGQTLGFIDIDTKKKTGTFDLHLPAQPEGKTVDVNPAKGSETGVQVFNVGYFPNLTGGPYSEGDDRSRGWLTSFASTKADPENEDEITGGRLVVWAADAGQFFPSDFGADGLLFTQDDPTMPVPAGYSVIDLDQKPFQIIREATVEMTLYEPADIAVKDFSQLGYQEAFDKMFATVRKEYAFNGIEGKQPDWDKLYAELAPRIKTAEENKDSEAYFLALQDFTLAFKDGHVSVDGGEVGDKITEKAMAGGYGFAIRELDNGTVVVVHVVENGPAAKAGMKVGAVVTEFNGQPIKDAIGQVKTPSPHSSDFTLRYEQAQFLLRGPVDTKAKVTFANPDSASKTVELTTIEERESLAVTSRFRGYDPNALPVAYNVYSGGIGYVKINSNYDDLNLIVRLFLRALQTFEKNEVENLIIDMRQNSGGANLGLAGFLTDQEIILGQLQYYSEKTGKFEADGEPGKITSNEEQFHFEKQILLVDQACASACELESYGFSQVPGMIVVGEYPTSGTEAEVARGQFKLPEGMEVRVPTGRFVLPDGSLFLEGQGVQPTVRVPVTKDSVDPSGDPVIDKVLELIQ